MDDKITILYMIDRISGLYGTEKHLLGLISGLNKSRYKPVVVSLYPQVADEFYRLGIPIYIFTINRAYSPLNILFFSKIKSICRIHNVDIIETFHSTSDMLGPLVGKLAGIKVILSNRRDMGFLRTKKHDAVYPFLNMYVTQIKVVCKAAVDYFSEIERTSSSKYNLFYNGIRIKTYANRYVDRKFLCHSIGLDPGVKIVGIVGNVKEVKGQKYLVEIARYLEKEHPNLKYLVVGGGMKNQTNPYLNDIKSELKTYKLEDKFVFTGHRNDVPDLVQLFDVALMLSLTEGCSNVLLEYMSSGKAVVATGVGGNPELIKDGCNGFIVPPADAKKTAQKIDLLLKDRLLRESMGQKNLRRALEYFNFSRSIDRHMNAYESLINKSNK